MKNLLKGIVCLAFLFPLRAQAADAGDPDQLFDRGQYQEALKIYGEAAKMGEGEAKWRAFYRACESEALIFRYGEAVERFKKAELPKDGLWRARLLILKAELFREFLKQYGYAAPTEIVEGEIEVFRRPAAELRKEVEAAYRELWGLREAMAKRLVDEEAYFLDVAKSDRGLYPTQLDFFVLRFGEHLLSESQDPEGKAKPDSQLLLKSDYPVPFASAEFPGAQAAALYEAAYRMGGEGRTEAAENWRLERALLPLRYSGRFAPMRDYNAGSDEAAALFERWMGDFKSPEAKARAGFEAASIHRSRQRYEEALRLCKRVSEEWAKTRSAESCEKLSAEIRRPELNLQAKTTPPDGKGALTATSRNLKEVYLRLYPLTPDEALRMHGEGQATWSSALNWVGPKAFREIVSWRTPSRSWTAPVKGSPYESRSTTIDLPDPALGVYLAVACSDKAFEPGSSMLVGAFLNVTNAVLFGSAGLAGPGRDLVYQPQGPFEKTLGAFWFYAMDGKSGNPLRKAEIDLFYGDYNNWERRSLSTDELGRASIDMPISLQVHGHSQKNADPLLHHQESWAFWANPLTIGFSPPPYVHVFVETERPIYRPGQKVAFKATVLTRIPQGFKTYDGAAEVRLKMMDANWQEVASVVKKPGPFGSVAGEFLIPAGRLLGRYRINAAIEETGGPYAGSVEFGVEEYKRPEFEATLAEAKGAWRFGKEATVEGDVKYYFGGPAPNANVTYIVTRETWRPWFCWWWSWRYPGGDSQEVLRGDVKTDENGHFKFAFTPQPRDPSTDQPPARFHVRVEAREAGGRTINAEKSYTAGSKAYLFSITPAAGFMMSDAAFRVGVKLMNLNEQAVSGKGSYTLSRIEKDPEAQIFGENWSGFPESRSIDQLYANVPDGPEVRRGALSFKEAGETPVLLKDLSAGAYRLKLKAEDPWGGEVQQAIVLLCADSKTKRLPLNISALALPEHAEYAVGENSRMLIGSAELSGTVHVEIWGGDNLLERRALAGGGVHVFELPLKEDHKGGVSVRWFGVKDYKARAGSATLAVPWKEKRLSVKLRHDKVLKPGQKAVWSLAAKDSQGKPVEAEASVRMFDRSLEYYAKAEETAFEWLYSERERPSGAMGSFLTRHGTALPVEKGWIKELLDLFSKRIQEPLPPGLRINRSRIHGRHRKFALARRGEMKMEESEGMMMEDKMVAVSAAAAPQMAMEQLSGGGMAKAKKDEGNAAPPPPQIRKDFSETAFYKPQLRLRAGKASFSLKAPERLTGWRIAGSVLTRDVKSGKFTAETLTRKDLMVRVEIPRFLREGDEAEFKAVVHNETEEEMTGSVSLSILEGEDPAGAQFGLKGSEVEFKAKAHGTSAHAWKVKAPRELKSFKIRTIARSGEKVDAEERDMPVLPSRQRVIDSLIAALNGDVVKKLTLKALGQKDETRINELLQLQVDPQLALAVLNSIPFLVHYPYECVEQTLNRYVPLAIVHAVYRKHPALAKAAAKLPRRKTLTPAWEGDDPKRMTELVETPWLVQSKGIESVWPVVNMLDPVIVSLEKDDALKKLQESQLPDGGFPWFPGGRADPYMTLLVLAGFAEAQRYGVDAPPELIERALRYVMSEIPRHLKPEEQEVSLLLYASYVVTSFPQKLKALPSAMEAVKFAKAWLDFADKHSDAMTQIGKAYAAQAYFKLGDKAKAELYLDRAMDGVRDDPISGAYWQPEKYSWLWYHDTLESHAFMLRTLQLLRPKDKTIPGLVQWMLFNRKGTEWKSTKASAAAVFALLDVLKARGALDKGDTYEVHWGPTIESVQIAPEDFLEKPLRWTKLGADIAKAGAPEVKKTGPGLAFASLTYIYTTEAAVEESEPGELNVSRKFYRRMKEGEVYRLTPLKLGETVKVGDDIEVQLKINTRSQFEYVQLKDPRGAGFEAEALLSGWKWDQLSRYEEPRDSLTNFFVSWLPHGEYVLKYRIKPTTAGKYRIGPAVMQSMYSPEFAAHSSGFELQVEEVK
ncbi:MAG: hypothetical protein HY922_02720 [Elusimicrobia bacterium]|nr:hypothetical protein [Elusimicrobiota bacterium]